MQQLTIIIPNYNGAHLLRRNLPSVIGAAKSYSENTAIIVVDDGSVDESVAVLIQDFPEIGVLRHKVNQGFAEAILTGVKSADTELLFLLNSDVELHQLCLNKLEIYFEDQATFSVSPLMINDDGTINRHSWNLRSFQRGYLKLVDWNIDEARESRQKNKLVSLYASGGCMMVQKSKFLELGGFHPIFKPFYGEDFDLGIRAWYRGWPTYFEPNATLVHQSHGSIKDNVQRSHVKEIRRRNRYFLEWMHIPKRRLWLSTIPYTILQLLGELATFDRTNLRGFLSALREVHFVIKERATIVKNQEINLEDLVKKLTTVR